MLKIGLGRNCARFKCYFKINVAKAMEENGKTFRFKHQINRKLISDVILSTSSWQFFFSIITAHCIPFTTKGGCEALSDYSFCFRLKNSEFIESQETSTV